MAIIDSVSIGNETRDIYDKGAMRGVSIKVSSTTSSERYYLIWEHVGAPQGYISPLQINGDIGGWNGGTKFDVSCVFNNIGNIPRIYGFKESDASANLIITRTSTSSSDSSTHDRLYIYFPTGLYYAEANLNIIPPWSVDGQGTFYTNPTPTTTYEGTFATSLAACPVTNKLVGLSDVNISNPLQGQVLEYDAASHKWINGAGDNPIPEGSTVTPTDDIQTWLHCGNIYDKNYTTISAVLADSTTLLALISSYNAVDYMVRSTTWASAVTANSTAMTDIGSNNYCADTLLANSTWRTAICNSTYFESVLNVKVPTISSSSSSVTLETGTEIHSSSQPWYCFNGILPDYTSSTPWNDGRNTLTFKKPQAGVIYQFSQPVNVRKIVLNSCSQTVSAVFSLPNYVISGSNNGTNWTQLASASGLADTWQQRTEIIDNDNKYTYFKLHTDLSVAGGDPTYGYYWGVLAELQYYGRA